MLTMETPLEWRKDWKLYRSTTSMDIRGNERRRYPETPDYIGKAGTVSGVCWQIKSSAWALEEFGEQATGGAVFHLFDNSVQISPFDRCAFGDRFWEVRSVTPFSRFRKVVLTEVGSIGG